MRFAFIKCILITIFLVGAIHCKQSSKPADRVMIPPRDVYIITATGMRPDHLSSYMYQSIQTQGLDYLAYDGIRFTRAFSTSTDSLPAHLSIFTGLFPTNKSIFETYQYFQTFTSATWPSIENLPQKLSSNGFRTAAFVADPELRSFVLRSGWFDTTYAGDSVLPLWQPSCENDRVRLQATEFSLNNKEKPHFVFMNFFEPTPPYQPPDPYDKHYPAHPIDGEIVAIDDQISRFIHKLKQAGIFERSILIFTAPYAENPEAVGRAGSLDEDNLKVPLMIVAPGLLPRHENYGSAISLVDLYPTITTLLNWNEGSNVDGKALFQKNNNKQITHDFLFGGSFFPSQVGGDPFWFGWNNGWMWSSNSGIVTRETGLSNYSTPESLMKEEKLIRQAVGERTSQLIQTEARAIPEGSILQLEEALILARTGKLEDSLKTIDSVPKTPFILGFQAELEEKLDRVDDSLATFKKAMQFSASPELLLRLARLEIGNGQIQAAQSRLKRYTGNMSYDIYSTISIVCLNQGKLDQAQVNIDAALRLNPRSEEAHHQQGLIYFAKGDFARAEIPLRKSLELQPGNKDTMLDLAATLAKLGKRDEVRRLCAAVLVHSPTPELKERAKDILAKSL